MVQSVVELRNIPGTEAAIGWSETASHTVVIDRPSGKAGGKGLGFNGGQMLALALGGCFCNNLRYVAHEMGIGIATLTATVTLDLEGTPLVTTAAELAIACETTDGSDPAALLEKTWATCMVANTLASGVKTSMRVL